MTVKQLSVFLENREGRLQQIFNILKEANVNVVSVSIAETSDYGIVRMIVSDVDGALAALKAQNITAKVVDVLAVNISHEVGSLSTLLNAIADAGINIKMIDQGSSELNIIIGVENKDFETAIRAIYDIFVTTQL